MDTRLTDYYAGKRILITGGASFIGSHLAELLVQSGARLTVADDLSSGRLDNLKTLEGKYKLLHGNLKDPAVAHAACSDQQLVFHLAAAHGGRGYIESHPVESVGNAIVDHNVFLHAARAAAEKIVFASSACVYPTTLQANDSVRLLLAEEDANFEEAGKAFADGEYGWAKLFGELQLKAIHKQFGISGIACRLFTAYGERENASHAVIALIAKAVARLDPYPIWGNGLQTRNFTYVSDTVMGLALSGASLKGCETLNLGTDQHHTILELTEEIFSCLNWRPGSLLKELQRPVGVLSRAADLNKTRKYLEWAPQVSLREGVRRTVAWYVKANPGLSMSDMERALMEREDPLKPIA